MKKNFNDFQLEVLAYIIVGELQLGKDNTKQAVNTTDQVESIMKHTELKQMIVSLADEFSVAEVNALRTLSHGAAARTSLASSKNALICIIKAGDFSAKFTSAYNKAFNIKLDFEGGEVHE